MKQELSNPHHHRGYLCFGAAGIPGMKQGLSKVVERGTVAIRCGGAGHSSNQVWWNEAQWQSGAVERAMCSILMCQIGS